MSGQTSQLSVEIFLYTMHGNANEELQKEREKVAK